MSNLSTRLEALPLTRLSPASGAAVPAMASARAGRSLAPPAPPVAPAPAGATGPQLSVSSYFSEALFRREQERIFARHPRYVGHERMVPEPGDHATLAHEGDGRVLLRQPDGEVTLLSNVCRHRQAVILRGRGRSGSHITCPLHRWTYDLKGALVAAPHFAEKPCLDLPRYPLADWNGLQFDAGGDGSDLAADVLQDLRTLDDGIARHLQFDGYVLDHVEMHECDYNWKTFIEVYLEDYHVAPFHPGLGHFVDCNQLAWRFGRHHSVQTVGIAQNLTRPGSPTYKRWHDAVLALNGSEPPAHGAIWLTLYPTVMVEWYPHVLVVSTLHPKGPQRTLNVVEFYYPEEIAAFERDLVEAERAAYMETCVEDDEIARRMDAGRKALYERGDDEAGPYQMPMEAGMQHFHRWYRQQMGGLAAGG